jgi:hypothetical protein
LISNDVKKWYSDDAIDGYLDDINDGNLDDLDNWYLDDVRWSIFKWCVLLDIWMMFDSGY